MRIFSYIYKSQELFERLALIQPFLGGLVSAVAGGVVSSALGQRSANKQMDFQERMSNTSYQRAMEDMKAAGLNPMLAYQQGGASTPGGASTGAPNVDIGGQQASLNSAKVAKQQEKNVKAQTDNSAAQARISKAEADLIEKQIEIIKKRPELLAGSATNKAIGSSIIGRNMGAAADWSSAAIQNIMNGIRNTIPKMDKGLDTIRRETKDYFIDNKGIKNYKFR
jgi:hypothetical protein